MITKGIYRSIWDGIETVVSSLCEVDTNTRQIVFVGNREVESLNEEVNIQNVDEIVDVLDMEEVEIDGVCYKACHKDDIETGGEYWYE